MRVLVAGGAGYIGTHTCLELLKQDDDVVVVDNLCNSKMTGLRRVEEMAGKKVSFYPVDVRDTAGLRDVFSAASVDAVINFAGLKAVGESTEIPLEYYDNNVSGTLNLLKVMDEFEVRTFVFSSSATVYGDPAEVPIKESFPTGEVTNPYGRAKLIIEDVAQDLAKANPAWNMCLLRYFNPVGAHESGCIGEDPNGIPNNLVPYISQVAVGKLECLNVFGDDYPTCDGTGVRDYIHVVDLAKGHLAALKSHTNDTGVHIYNLGTGKGYSVLQMLHAFEKSCGKTLPYKIVPRRAGDIAECWADPALAAEKLGWKTERNLEMMMADTWRWQSENPHGYED
ncbi:UDP-glucose 4-epimerase [invertebrate metagenome]|uniref:UDP-glucose 4-epimerase n=1 Tax=invertebrate metagenome TaxID=1711999 RepID=A0A2H9T6U6_9ZZZZ